MEGRLRTEPPGLSKLGRVSNERRAVKGAEEERGVGSPVKKFQEGA